MNLTEEQKNLTLGQVEEMKNNLQNEIANDIIADGIDNYSKNFSYVMNADNQSVLNVSDTSYINARNQENMHRDTNLTTNIMNRINEFYNATGIQVNVTVHTAHNDVTDINGNYTCQIQPVVEINL